MCHACWVTPEGVLHPSQAWRVEEVPGELQGPSRGLTLLEALNHTQGLARLELTCAGEPHS